MDKHTISTIIPHADLGAPDCCGCLDAIIREDQAVITCNECGAVIYTVALDDLRRMLDDMELNLAQAAAKCNHYRRH